MAFGAINARSASARSRRLAAGLIAAAEDTLRRVTRLRGFAEAANNHVLSSHNGDSVASQYPLPIAQSLNGGTGGKNSAQNQTGREVFSSGLVAVIFF